MKVLRQLWFSFQMIRETMIKSRYKETSKGKAEQTRLYNKWRFGVEDENLLKYQGD